MSVLENIWIQISLGLLPAVIVSVILLFKKKVFRMAYLSLALCLTAACVGGCYMGISEIIAEQEEHDAIAEARETIDKEDLVQLAYSFLRNFDTESASRIVGLYSDLYGYDDVCTLINARTSVLDRRFESALGAYKKLYGKSLPDEALAAEKIVLSYRTDMALAEQLIAAGYNVPATYDDDEIAELTFGGAQDIVFEAIDDEKIDEDYLAGAQWITQANELFDDYLENGYADQDMLEDLMGSLEDLESDKTFRKLEVFREARLKVMLLNGDFDSIVEYLDEFAGCAEYATVLELYISDLVEKDAIENALNLKNYKGLNQLIKQLEHILKDGEKTLSNEDLTKLENQIEMLNAYKDDKVMYTMEDRLLDEAEDPDNYETASKLYMSLVKLSGKQENITKRNQYFSDALVTAPASNDGDYSDAMNDLSDVISGDGGDSLVKDIPKNAEKAVENSYFIPGTGKLIQNNEAEDELTGAVQESTIKFSAAVTINSVDPSNFEEVVIRVQLSDEMISERELLNLVRLNDCNYNIKNYTIKKVEYTKSNIILCCDNSGSMSGSIGSLRNAVRKFLEASHEKETIGFYTFDDEILQSLPLGTASDSALNKAIDDMGSHGGTAIFETLSTILSSANYDSDASQVIILMTDGQDGNHPTMDDIHAQIGDVASRKGYVVYVLGMGSSINYDYLSTIAQSGGGRCIYSPSDSELESLYQFIHGALQNQYEITFNAEDTLTSQGRRVVVSLDQKNVQSSKTYSVGNEDAQNASVDFDEGVCVRGLSERMIFRQKNNVEVFVNGTGFKSSDHMYLTFSGERTYGAETEYVSDTQFRVILPENMAEGVYDMEVHLSGRKALYLQELTVVEGEPDEIIFGGYRFKAYKIKETSTGYTLSNYVTMNNWLHFNGTVTLTGSLDDAQMTLSEYSGSYVNYAEAGDPKGYALELKNKGVPLQLPSLGSLTIYNAVAYGLDYPTVAHEIPAVELLDLMLMNHPRLHLYPDRITMEIGSGETKLPLQDFFVTMMNEKYSPFQMDFNFTGTITGSNVAIAGEVVGGYVEPGSAVEALTIDFLDMRASLQKDLFEFKINTLTGFYRLGFNVKIPVFEAWVGASFWFENGGFDGFEIRFDKDFTIDVYTVPITFSDFKIGMDNFTETNVTVAPSDLYLGELKGGFKASAYKVSALIPPLKKYVGDLNLVSADAEVSTQLGVAFIYNLMGKSEIKLLDLATIAEAELKIGRFTHTDALLGMDEATVTGFYYSVSKVLKIDVHNFYMDFKGSQKEFVFTNRLLGLRYSGGLDLKLDWWGFDPEFHLDGAATVGFFLDSDNLLQFTVRASWTDGNKRKGILYYIREDGDKVKDWSHKY